MSETIRVPDIGSGEGEVIELFVKVGDRIALGSHTFTADDIKAFARTYDPQPFHMDEAAAVCHRPQWQKT